MIPKVAAVFQSVQIDPAGGETDPRGENRQKGLGGTTQMQVRDGRRRSVDGSKTTMRCWSRDSQHLCCAGAVRRRRRRIHQRP
ncbi:hypothetical protein U1Q18_019714 [Sarracenia purpurea var. burkii]